MTKLVPEVKKLWVEALRSGKYKQGKSALRTQDKFCCLGVLCDISGKGTWIEETYVPNEKGVMRYTTSKASTMGYLPPEVEGWASKVSYGRLTKVVINGEENFLAKHNDSGRTFEEIAKAIEEQL